MDKYGSDDMLDEYDGDERARERALEVYEYLDNMEGTYDDMEMYCIAVLDSEFMDYPDGSLENYLQDVLSNLRFGG